MLQRRRTPRAANSEILDTAREAAAARQRSNCVRLSVMRNRLNDIRVDPNHPFWTRHGLDKDPAARERVMQNLTRSVTQLFSLDCSQPAPPKFALDAGFRHMNRFAGDKLGVGVVVTPGDPFFLKTPDRVDGWSAHLNWQVSFKCGAITSISHTRRLRLPVRRLSLSAAGRSAMCLATRHWARA